jgi:HK97 family phage prohead protease
MPERSLDFDTEITAVKAEGEDLIVEGYFATYDLDNQNERWLAGSWTDAIKAFMDNPSRPVLYEHKREYGQFGEVLALEERDEGLWGRIRLPQPSKGVLRQAWEAVKAGLTKGVSVRAPMLANRQSDGTVIAVPRRITEFSITPFPVAEGAVVAVAQKAFEEDDGTDELAETLQGYTDQLTLALDGIEQRLAPPGDTD